MAYSLHSDVSNYMVTPAFDANSTPSSTQVTAAIVHADARIDQHIGTASVSAAALKLASAMIVQEMINRGRIYLIESEDSREILEDILTPGAKRVLQEGMDDSSDIPVIVTSQSGYQTSDNPDDFC